MVTHDAHAAAIADRILFLADGAVVNDLGQRPPPDPRGPPGGERPVIRVALKGVLGRKLRAALTAFAIVLGVAMISGSLVLTDTVAKSFDGVYDASYKDSDAVVTSKAAITDGGKAPAFTANILQNVQHIPDVSRAGGSIEDEARLVNDRGRSIGAPGSGIAVGFDGSSNGSLSPYKLASGRWPTADGQIAIDTATADDQHFAVGDTVGAFADGPVKKYKVTGIVRFGTEDSIAGSSILVFDLPTAQRAVRQAGQARPHPRRRGVGRHRRPRHGRDRAAPARDGASEDGHAAGCLRQQ